MPSPAAGAGDMLSALPSQPGQAEAPRERGPAAPSASPDAPGQPGTSCKVVDDPRGAAPRGAAADGAPTPSGPGAEVEADAGTAPGSDWKGAEPVLAGRCSPLSPNFWVYNIPICGGFCAPTVSPEGSCLRHFSNEYTLPLGPRFVQCSPVIEHSCCCVGLGRLGLGWAERRRKKVMLFGALMNGLSLVLCVIAAAGGLASDSGSWAFRAFPWVRSSARLSCSSAGATSHIDMSLLVNVKLHHISVDCSSMANPEWCESSFAEQGFEVAEGGTVEKATSWDDPGSCKASLLQDVSRRCESCADSLISESSLIISILGQLPTIATDLQRSTRFGDVNCQKTMGMLSNLFTFFSSLVALLAFRWYCYETSQDTSDLLFDLNGLTCEVEGSVDKQIGPGFRCLVGATCIKIVDLICHALVPTPRERWTKPKDPPVRDAAEYLMMASRPQQSVPEHLAPDP